MTGNTLYLDFETKDRGISAGLGPGWPYAGFLDVIGFSYSINGKPPKWSTTVELLRDLVDISDTVVAHNAAYELGVLEHLGIDYSSKEIIDTLLLAKLFNNQRFTYSLDSLGTDYLGDRKTNDLLAEKARELKLVKSKAQDAVKYAKINLDVLYKHCPEVVIEYANHDVHLLIKLYEFLKDKVPDSMFKGLLSDLQKAVTGIRKRGVLVDTTLLHASEAKLSQELELATARLREFIGDGNPNSTAALVAVLDRHGIAYPVTDKGNPSITAKWVESQEGEFFEALNLYRKLNKLHNDFVVKIKTMIEVAYGQEYSRPGNVVRIHPELNVMGATATGRFSSSNFNMQQLPKRDPYAKPLVRGFIVPESGCDFYCLDFCYDANTEVLTHTGFKRWEDVQDTDLLATYAENGNISYELPSRLVRLPYVGDMHRFTGRHIDLLVSPNHRMIRLTGDGRITEMKAYEGHKPGYKNIHAGIWDGGIEDSMIRLKVAVQADGTIRKNSSGKVNGIRFKLKKDRKIERLCRLLESHGIEYHTNTPPSWTAAGFSMVYIPTFEGIEDIAVKEFTEDFVNNLSVTARDELLDELRYWDGTGSGPSYTYFTASLSTANAVQLAAILSNRRASVALRQESGGFSAKPQYAVYIGETNTTYTCGNTYGVEYYNGTIYCATVSTGMLIVRRGGKVTVSSNCAQEPRLQVHYSDMIGSAGGKELSNRWCQNPDFDMHGEVAKICGIERTPAKIINLGLSYGMSATKLAKTLKLSDKQARALIATYHEKAPYLKDLTDACKAQLKKNGGLRSLLGRKITKPDDFYDEETGRVQDFLYKGINMLIQGSAADQTVAAIVEAYRAGIELGYPIHDELTASLKSDLEAVQLRHIMENCVRLRVPSKSEITKGPTFAAQEELSPILSDIDSTRFEDFKARYTPILDLTR